MRGLIVINGAAALTDLFFNSGIDVIIVEGPFFTRDEREGYTRYLRTSLPAQFVTLTVSYEESLRRATGDPHPGRVVSKDPAWLRERHDESSALLAPLQATDKIVETDDRSAAQVAQEIVSAAGVS